MHSPEIYGEGELRGQSGSPGKWPLKRSVFVCIGGTGSTDKKVAADRDLQERQQTFIEPENWL